MTKARNRTWSSALDPKVAKRRASEQQYRYRLRDRYIAEWLYDHDPKLYEQAETSAAAKILAERGDALPGDPQPTTRKQAS